jgi:PAS domain S-box-containing protein
LNKSIFLYLNNSSDDSVLIILLAYIFAIITLAFISNKRRIAKKKASILFDRQYEEISIQKKQIESQRDIINYKNKELEQAQNTIQLQNKKLREANEKLEEMVILRTQELMKTFQKLTFHVDNAPLAVLEMNNKLELTRWSSRAEELFGYNASDVLGKNIRKVNFIYIEDIPFIDNMLVKMQNGINPKSIMKTRMTNENGDIIYMEWSNSVLLNEDGKVESILCIGNDVTDREKATKRLESINKELNDFLYKASHDLRGPIARIRGLINLGLLEANEETSLDYFERLENVAYEMNTILSKLLTIYDINHHAFKVEEINPFILTKNLVWHKEQLKKEPLYDINLDIDKNIKWNCDRILFEAIIENFLDNATAYNMKDVAKINLSIHEENSKLKIIVSDYGCGIDEMAVDKIFDIFFQGNENADLNSGLNLYMAKKAIEKLGGSIELISSSNPTTFEVKLPCLGQVCSIQENFKKLSTILVNAPIPVN